MDNLGTLWEKALNIIEKKLNEQGTNTVFKNLKLLSYSNNNAIIEVPNNFIKDWIKEHYLDVINKTLSDVFNEVIVNIEFQVSKTTSQKPFSLNIKKKKVNLDSNIPIDDFLNQKYTFDSFVVGQCNQFANAACLAVAELPSTAYNPLFIYGGVGLGKTHLLHAIGNKLKSKDNQSRIAYVSSEKFTNELINAIRYDETTLFRAKYRNVDILLIDDIQFIAGKERTQEEFFHTFNSLYESHKQIVVSSDSPPKEIPTIEERLRSRFEWGLIADIQIPDLETRVAILKRKAEMESISLPDDVAFFIAEKIKSSIRELEGCLIRVAAFSSLSGNEITLSFTKEVLGNILSENKNQITIEKIQKVVADHFNLKVSDFKSKCRTKNIVLPKQIAMYIAKTMTDASFSMVADKFGGKDHTTILYAYKKIKKRLTTDGALRKNVDNLMNIITQT
ncbi:MAG: chromosomal replication initiator protein DnaA [bacterium]